MRATGFSKQSDKLAVTSNRVFGSCHHAAPFPPPSTLRRQCGKRGRANSSGSDRLPKRREPVRRLVRRPDGLAIIYAPLTLVQADDQFPDNPAHDAVHGHSIHDHGRHARAIPGAGLLFPEVVP